MTAIAQPASTYCTGLKIRECEEGPACMPYKAALADWKAEGPRVLFLPAQEKTKEEGAMLVSKENDRTTSTQTCGWPAGLGSKCL